jgi:hypothetical protein
MSVQWIVKFLPVGKPKIAQGHIVIPLEEQIKVWHTAVKKMVWGIKKEEFTRIGDPPSLTRDDLEHGYIGVCLFYGFGDDGSGNADAVISG